MITVPYVPQRGNKPRNDCGPACVLMIARALGKMHDVTLDALSARIDPNDDGTTAADLAQALKGAGLTPVAGRKSKVGYPCIALVKYERLPQKNKSAPGAAFNHWIVRLTGTTYHDPYFFDQRGANLNATNEELDYAELDVRVSVEEILSMQTQGAFARLAYTRRYLIAWRGDSRWPQYPGATDEQHALLEKHRRQNRFTLGDSFDDAGLAVVTSNGEHGPVVVELWGWPEDKAVRDAYNNFFKTYYPHASIIYRQWSELQNSIPIYGLSLSPSKVKPGETANLSWYIENVREAYINGQGITGPSGSMKVSSDRDKEFVLRVVTQSGQTLQKSVVLIVVQDQPQNKLPVGRHPALPALPFHLRLGMHVMNRIEELRECYDLGCRSFTVLDNVAAARWAREQGCAVILRRFFVHGPPPTPEQAVQMLGINRDDRLMVMGINEADNIATSDLVARFAWDKAFAETVWRVAPNCFPLIGSFSMGTPQIDDAGVAKVFRDTYARFLNANVERVGLNYHSYHRRHSNTVPPWNHPVESPIWWPQRFTKFGFDPNLGGLSRDVVIAGDETGVDIGGIGGFPACGYNDDSFLKWWALRKEEYEGWPNVYVQNIFQYSPAPDWQGYNARAVLGGCAKVWRGG